MKPVQCEFTYGDHKVILETGRVARQATGAVLVTMNDTVVLCTAVGSRTANPAQSFFPLTVNYQERAYAGGRIPGSFFRREGRPTEQETLICRLIDRSIRPLFPKGFMNEVQVVCTVMSADAEMPPDIPAFIGASAALSLSGLPFEGPIAAARVGFKEGLYLLNPTYSQLADSSLNIVAAGTKNAILMVESEASELSEDLVLGGILFAQQQMQVAVDAIRQLTDLAGKPKWSIQVPTVNPELTAQVQSDYQDQIKQLCEITERSERQTALAELKTTLRQNLPAEEDKQTQDEAVAAFNNLYKQTVRERILAQAPRIDGRDAETVRPIDIEVGLLPRTHGSALFVRGETQAIATAILGSQKDSALVEGLTGIYRERFLLHYNFPPYSVGETGFMGGPKRREIGHGNLARRALVSMLPKEESFPYTIRVVSEITESNGSSSMASVCGASLALMDAGVPMKAAVAGVAMGLVLEGERFAVLTDIMGDEDHLGDMDFKVAGTAAGITALQMDIKVEGISGEIMEQALKQAKVARLHILQQMNKVLSASRTDVAENAPSFKILKIPVDKIRDLIGKGGVTIRGITEETGASVDVTDDGTVSIYGENKTVLEAAVKRVEAVSAEAEVHAIYQGVVKSVVDFGAFVEILPGKQGLVHISEITGERIERVSDYLSEGQTIDVKVLGIDHQGRIKLSMKAINEDQQQTPTSSGPSDSFGSSESPQPEEDPLVVGQIYPGKVSRLENYGGFVEIRPGKQGLVHRSEITNEWVENVSDHLHVGQEVEVCVLELRNDGKIALSIKAVSQEHGDHGNDQNID